MEKIKYYKSVLGDENLLFGVIKDEILAIKAKYSDERRTQIENNPGEIDLEDLIEEETNVITLSHLNYIKRTSLDSYKSQNRGGRGIIGMQTRDEDAVKDLFLASTHDTILFFTNFGKVYRLKGYQIPEGGRVARGISIVNLLEINQGEKISAVIPVREFSDEHYLIMITKQGVIKKTGMGSYANIRKGGLNAINIREDDSLIAVMLTDGKQDVLVATHNGMGIRFNEDDVRPMGRTATGVRAIKLREDDYVVSADIINDESRVLNVTENGYGKRTIGSCFNVQNRGGIGVKIHQITEKTGKLCETSVVNDNEELMIITSGGVIIRLRGADISTFGRASQGVKLINLDDGVSVVGIAKVSEDDIYAASEAAVPKDEDIELYNIELYNIEQEDDE